MSEISIVKFLCYTKLGSLIWNLVLIVIGSIVVENWKVILKTLDTYSHIVVIALLIVLVMIITMIYKKRVKK